MRGKNFAILYRQDWFAIDWYKRAVAKPTDYIDINKFREYKRIGDSALASGDIQKLRDVNAMLYSIRRYDAARDDMFAAANIVKG